MWRIMRLRDATGPPALAAASGQTSFRTGAMVGAALPAQCDEGAVRQGLFYWVVSAKHDIW